MQAGSACTQPAQQLQSCLLPTCQTSPQHALSWLLSSRMRGWSPPPAELLLDARVAGCLNPTPPKRSCHHLSGLLAQWMRPETSACCVLRVCLCVCCLGTLPACMHSGTRIVDESVIDCVCMMMMRLATVAARLCRCNAPDRASTASMCRQSGQLCVACCVPTLLDRAAATVGFAWHSFMTPVRCKACWPAAKQANSSAAESSAKADAWTSHHSRQRGVHTSQQAVTAAIVTAPSPPSWRHHCSPVLLTSLSRPRLSELCVQQRVQGARWSSESLFRAKMAVMAHTL